MYGMNDLKIKTNREGLLTALRKNREQHEKDYDKAKKGFRILIEKELEKKLEAVKAGKSIKLEFKNRKPQNFLSSYDDVIGMLEISTDVEITLNHQQYKQYINDEWDWMGGWQLSNTAYLSAAV